jgi:hypothetical protein
MSTPDRFLRTLDAPAGGWQRLIQRRDADASPWLVPLTATLASAAAVFIFVAPWLDRRPLELELNAARLVGERSTGISLQILDGREMVALPSGDPNVRLYWVTPAVTGKSVPHRAGTSP